MEWSKHFDRDLRTGKNYEYIVLHNLQKKFPAAFKIEGAFKEYDIYVPEKEFGIEVKFDGKSNETGNILIELEFPIGTLSGLSTTKSKYWIITDGKDYFSITPDSIRKFAKENNIQSRPIRGEGDSQPKLVWLLPKQKFFKSCKKIELDPNI